MNWLKKIKEWETKFDIKTWGKGYKVNKLIFNIALVFVIFLFILLWSDTGFSNIREPYFYLECNEPVCENEFYSFCNINGDYYYRHESFCEKVPEYMYQSFLMYKGESVGVKPTFLMEWFNIIFILVFVLAFIINHLLYNKGWRYKE